MRARGARPGNFGNLFKQTHKKHNKKEKQYVCQKRENGQKATLYPCFSHSHSYNNRSCERVSSVALSV